MVIIDIHLLLIVPDIAQDVILLWRDAICIHVTNVSHHCICIFVFSQSFSYCHMACRNVIASQQKSDIGIHVKTFVMHSKIFSEENVPSFAPILHPLGFQWVISRLLVNLLAPLGRKTTNCLSLSNNVLFNSFLNLLFDSFIHRHIIIIICL